MAVTNCSMCGAVVKRDPGYIAKYKHIFCGKVCRSKWMSENMSGKNHYMWKGGPSVVNCAECGKPIVRPRFDIDTRSERFFCNLKCRGKWMSKNMIGPNHPGYQGNYLKTECAQCGKPLEIENWRKGRGNRNFCNYDCMGQWVSENRSGEACYNWKGGHLPYYGPNWNRQREAARERDNYQCQHCGMTEEEHREDFGCSLHVHHIKPLREFEYKPGENDNYKLANSLKNLITLCAVCHQRMEAGKIQLAVDHN